MGPRSAHPLKMDLSLSLCHSVCESYYVKIHFSSVICMHSEPPKPLSKVWHIFSGPLKTTLKIDRVVPQIRSAATFFCPPSFCVRLLVVHRVFFSGCALCRKSHLAVLAECDLRVQIGLWCLVCWRLFVFFGWGRRGVSGLASEKERFGKSLLSSIEYTKP